MIKLIVALFRWVFGGTQAYPSPVPVVFVAPEPPAEPAPAPEPAGEEPPIPEPIPERAPASLEAEYSGEFWFKDTVLDRLDEYMIYLRRMKLADPDSYALYSRVGASICPQVGFYESIKEHNPVPGWFLETRPAFAGLHVGSRDMPDLPKDGKEWFEVKFVFLTKYKRQPAEVQFAPPGWDFYKVGIMWDQAGRTPSKHEKKTAALQEFPVALSPTGELTILRTLVSDTQTIVHKRGQNGKKRNGGTSTITRQRWGIAPEFHRWAATHKITAPEILRWVFVSTCELQEKSQASMIQVRCEKDGLAAVFGVHITRTPYFFNDRDVTVDRKRIFHIARAHIRTMADGRQIPIRTHFRGLREFAWNGYDVLITVPGWHHNDVRLFDAGSYDSGFVDQMPVDKRRGFIETAALGKTMVNVIKSVKHPLDGIERGTIH